MRTAKSILTILISLLAWSNCTSLAAASTVLFTDDFSNGLDQWQQVRPQATAWQIRNEAAYIRIDQQFSISELVPRDDLWQSEWHNLRFELDYTPISGFDRNISFHFQDVNNWYELHFTDQTLHVLHLEQGVVAWSKSQPFQLLNGQTYHLELRLHDQTITVFINGQLISHQTDPTFSRDYGRIGLKAGTGASAPTEIIIDNVVVSEYSAANLGVALLKQTDQTWATDEYDSAAAWAPEAGIDAWGCALTSLTMIFHHYGISRLPDGSALTPQTFNVWLKSQPDGYVGEGLVNWQAGLRLARHSHEQYGTPLLAYRKVVDDWQTALQSELTALRPAIIQLPGHFVVAEGIAATHPLDFAIADPAFPHTRLNQHTQQAVSIRTFTPVSDVQPTITVLAHTESTVQLTNSNTTGVQTVDQIRSSSSQSTPFQIVELVSTLASATLKFAQPLFKPLLATVMLHSNHFEPLINLVIQPIAGPNGVRFRVSTGNTGTSVLTPVSSFAELQQDLAPLQQQGLLSTQPALQLRETLSVAHNKPSHTTTRYKALAQMLLPTTSNLGTQYLLQQLAAIE